MRKKQLLEQLAAHEQKRQAELDRLTLAAAAGTPVPPEEITALTALDGTIAEVKAEIEALEKLETLAAANHGRGTAQVRELAEDKPYESFGEFLADVARSPERPNETNMGQVAPRLRKFSPASGSSVTTPSDGGYAIGKAFGDFIIRRIYETGQVLSQVPAPIPLDQTGKIELPLVAESSRANGSRFGGVRVYRNDEAGTVTASRPKIEGWKLEAAKMTGIWYATEELLRNAGAMSQIAELAFTEEMRFTLEQEIWAGNGVGQCLGFLTAGGAKIAVAKETSQTAATINVDNIGKMYSRMPANLRANAVWFISQEAEQQLDKLAISNQPVYMPPGGFSERPFGRLKGLPVIPVEHAEALGTEGDIVLANLRDTYLLGQMGGVESASSIHVRFLYGETAFRWNWFISGKPTFTQTITPLKGSHTLSPYITLATRA